MIRKAAQMRLSMDKPRNNGHLGSSISQLMDVDENMELDEGHLLSEIEELERSMLKYGQTLQAEYANDPRKEVSQALADIFPLAAYVNPLKEPMFSHLLDRSGRVAVAEELNSAILREFYRPFLFGHFLDITRLTVSSVSGQIITRSSREGLCSNHGPPGGSAARGWSWGFRLCPGYR